MSNATLSLVSDKSISGWTANGFSDPPTAYATALTDGSDSTYMAFAGSGGTAIFNLSALPGDVGVINSISIGMRCYVNSTKNSPIISAQIKNSSGSTVLSGVAQFAPTTSFSVITEAAAVSDSNPVDWAGATLVITSDGKAAENVSEVLGVFINYTPASFGLQKIINNSMVVSCNSVF